MVALANVVCVVLSSAGHGTYLRGPVPGGRVGLLRRVQPSGGEDAVGRVPAGPVHPGGSEGAQQPQQGQKYVYSLSCL